MGPITVAELAEDALLLMDSAPIIYFLEANPKFSAIFKPFFVAHDAGRLQFAVWPKF
jgi:hypothetical protein